MKGHDTGNLQYYRKPATIEDDYSEKSGGRRFGERYGKIYQVKFPNDNIKPEELNGEVVIIKPGKRKD